jgi:hypothetical protein
MIQELLMDSPINKHEGEQQPKRYYFHSSIRRVQEAYLTNIPAALISAAVGAAFLGAASAYYYQPSLITPDDALFEMLTTSHSKARAAVSRLLINPPSARFDALRSVEADAAKYVCGKVNAKDKADSYAGYREFVYTVAIDFARIDDDGRIAQRHVAFKPCPISEEQQIAQQKTAISPGALSMLSIIQKNIPASDPSTLSTLASQTPAGSKTSSGASMTQQLGQLAGQSPSGGQQTNSGSGAAPINETDWRGDRPPAAWPMFPSDHPLGRAAAKRTPAEAIAFAQDVDGRWAQSKSGNALVRPSSEEIREACRALLTIDPKSEEFPKAWGIFVRLRKIDRDAGQS